MSDQILDGIAQSARNLFTPNSPTPSSTGSHTGIHMGIVVDDVDDYALDSQRKGSLGRVWVYIPGISARNPDLTWSRYTNTREPRADDGTPGKPIPEKRSGFILAYPMTPHAGSDRLREAPNQPDGRNPGIGQSNSYGDFHQARNGDSVAVCFLGGDPGKCYIVGHMPKTAEHAMVPGLKQAQTDATGSGVSTNVGPAYNKGDDDKTTKPASVFFNNLTDSGLINDPQLRGCGTSSSDRESPSRVRGWKSPGDPDTGMNGHQMLMDDHPKSQMMRLRTSKGMQILLSDTGDFMYMCTATGKTWIEIDDGGNCHVFAHSSVSIHTEQDFNFVCDRDFNLHVGGNANMNIKGDTRIRMNKGGNITVGEGGGDLDITTINNFHVKSQGEVRVGAKTGITAVSQKFFAMQAAENISMKTPKGLHADTKQIALKSSDSTQMQSGKDFSLKSQQAINMKAAGGNFNADTSASLNATKATLVVDDVKFNDSFTSTPSMARVFFEDAPVETDNIPDALLPNQADLTLEHSVASPPPTSGPPKSPTTMTKYGAPVVPQHEPWMGHRAENPGHDAAVEPSSIPKLL